MTLREEVERLVTEWRDIRDCYRLDTRNRNAFNLERGTVYGICADELARILKATEGDDD